MIHTILVPLDGSRLAERALPEARRLARATDATIVLVRVARGGTALQDPWAAQAAALGVAEAYLRDKARALSRAGFGVQTDVYCTDPAEGIGLAAMVHGASLIVMSTHGRSGLRRAVLGSVAERVVHDAAIPVLLVPRGSRTRPSGPYRKVLVPLDGSPLAETALRYLTRETFAQQATVVLLKSVPAADAPHLGDLVATAYIPARLYDQEWGEAVYEDERHEIEHRCAQATHYLDSAALTYLGDQPWHSAVVVGTRGEQIADLATDEAMDLIVMATHGRVGTDRLLHGSVAGAVVRQAAVPVLLLRGVVETTRGAEQAAASTAGRVVDCR